MTIHAKYRGKVLFFAALAVAISCLVFFLPFQQSMLVLLDRLRSWGVWGLVALGILYVFACVLLVPGSILTLGAGFLAAAIWPTRPMLALSVGTLVVWISSVLGASAAFLLVRTGVRGWIMQRLGHNKRFERLDEAVLQDGFKVVLLLRLSPIVPFNILNYVLGLTAVRFTDFVVASSIGMLPATILFVYAGCTAKSLASALAGRSDLSMAHHLTLALGLLATLLLVAVLTRIARKALSDAEVPGK